MEKRYNGWTNFETWLVALWMDNDEGSQSYAMEMAEEAIREAIDNGEDDARYAAACAMADRLKDEHDEAAPDLGCSLWSDLLSAATSEVNWYEIASHYVSDVSLFVAGWNFPGCLYEGGPAFFTSADDAREYLLEMLDAEEHEHFAKEMTKETGEFSMFCDYDGMYYSVKGA